MSAKYVINICSQYNIARKEFLSTIAKLAQQPKYVDMIISSGVVELMIPLLTDVIPSIHTTAATVFGRLGSGSEAAAWKLLTLYNIVFHLIKDLRMRDSHYQKNVMFALGSIGKHSAATAELIVTEGGIEEIVVCLGGFDLQVKEVACWAIGLIGRTDHRIAKIITNEGALPLIMNCLEENNDSLQKLSISSLGDIGKLCKDAAQIIMDRGGFHVIAKYVIQMDSKYKVAAMKALGHLASHSVELAQGVLTTKLLPHVVLSVSNKNNALKISAVWVILNIAKHSKTLAKTVLNAGVLGELINIIANANSEALLESITAIGHIASHSSDIAIQVVEAHAVYHMVNILRLNTDQGTLIATVWALGQIGKHSDREVEYLCAAGALDVLMEHYRRTCNSAQLRKECNTSLRLICNKCQNVGALKPFLHDVPCEIQEYAVHGLSNFLQSDSKARYEFVKTGGLAKLLCIEPELGTQLFEDINALKLCFPQDIVRYYMPTYPAGFMPRLESFYPELHPHFITEEEYKAMEDDQHACCHLQEQLKKESELT